MHLLCKTFLSSFICFPSFLSLSFLFLHLSLFAVCPVGSSTWSSHVLSVTIILYHIPLFYINPTSSQRPPPVSTVLHQSPAYPTSHQRPSLSSTSLHSPPPLSTILQLAPSFSIIRSLSFSHIILHNFQLVTIFLRCSPSFSTKHFLSLTSFTILLQATPRFVIVLQTPPSSTVLHHVRKRSSRVVCGLTAHLRAS